MDDFTQMARRLGTARAEATRLLSEAGAGVGVWMRNLGTEARVIVRQADTLARLIGEGWVHDPDVATPSEAADAASSPVADDSPSPATEATPAPPPEPTEASSDAPTTDAPLTKGKKA